MLVLRVFAVILIVLGVLTVFGARWLVGRYNLDRNIKCDFENEMDEAELKQYKMNKAVVNMKMTGMLVALPGFILIMVLYR